MGAHKRIRIAPDAIIRKKAANDEKKTGLLCKSVVACLPQVGTKPVRRRG